MTTMLDLIQFVRQRDGDEAAVTYAKQSLNVSRIELREGRTHRRGYGRAYRRNLVRNALACRTFLRSNA